MDSIRIFGYKSFKELSVQLHPINLLIGANGAGKSNFLSLFEMLGNIYEKRFGAYVAQVGGVDKLLYQGRKVTDRIAVNLLIAKSEYDLVLLESDGKLIVEREVVGICVAMDIGLEKIREKCPLFNEWVERLMK